MRRSLLVVLLGLLVASPALAIPKIAVLDFQGSGLGAAESETIQRLGQITDAARSGAIKAVRGRFNVLTKANQDEVLAAQGFDPLACEGECEVSIMRRMQVEYGFTGQVVAVSTRWRIQLDLYNVKTGVAMDTETINIEGEDPGLILLDALDRVSTATGAMLKRSLRLSGGTTTTIQEGSIGDTGGPLDFGSSGRVQVTFASEPPGAVVLLDGELLCSATPCTKLVASGAHDVRMTMAEYHAASQAVNLTEGTSSVSITLKPKFGIVDVITVPPGLGISINGQKRAEKSPLRGQRLTAGPYRILVDDPCWREQGEQILLKEGERREVRIEPQQKVVGLLVDAQDENKNEALVQVTIDGEPKGSNADFIPVSVCARLLKVQFQDGKVIEKALSLDPGQIHTRLVVSLAEEKVKETRLEVNANVSGAEVFVDGTRVGVTPLTMPALPGRHEIRVSHDEYEEGTATVDIPAGETGRAHLTLKEKWNPIRDAGRAVAGWDLFYVPESELPLRAPRRQASARPAKRGPLVLGLGTHLGFDSNPYRTNDEANGEDISLAGDLIVTPRLGIHPLAGVIDLGLDVFGEWRSFTGLDDELPANVAMLDATALGYLGLNRQGRAYLSVSDEASFRQMGGRVYEGDGGLFPLGPWAELDQSERFRNTLVAEGGLRPGFGLTIAGGYRMVLDRWFASEAITDFAQLDRVFDFGRYFGPGTAVSYQSMGAEGSVAPGFRTEKRMSGVLDSLLHEGYLDVTLRTSEALQLHARAHAGDYASRTTPSNPLGAAVGAALFLGEATLSLDVGYEMPFVYGAPVSPDLVTGLVGEARVGLLSDDIELSLFGRRDNATVPLYVLQTVNEAGLETIVPLGNGMLRMRGTAGFLELGRQVSVRDDEGGGSKPPFPVTLPGDTRGDFFVAGELGMHVQLSSVLFLEMSAGGEWYGTDARTPGAGGMDFELSSTPLGWFRGYTHMGMTVLLDPTNASEMNDFGDFFGSLLTDCF